MSLLLEVVGQLVIEFFGEIVLELVFSVLKQVFRNTKPATVLSVFGYLALGIVLGGLSLWAHPLRFLYHRPVPGVSLVLAPLLGGIVMAWWGGFRRAGGHVVTGLATFWGGAAFLFGYALVRFLGAH